jgi:RPA family protein
METLAPTHQQQEDNEHYHLGYPCLMTTQLLKQHIKTDSSNKMCLAVGDYEKKTLGSVMLVGLYTEPSKTDQHYRFVLQDGQGKIVVQLFHKGKSATPSLMNAIATLDTLPLNSFVCVTGRWVPNQADASASLRCAVLYPVTAEHYKFHVLSTVSDLLTRIQGKSQKE